MSFFSCHSHERPKKHQNDYRDYLDEIAGLRQLHSLIKELDDLRHVQRTCINDIDKLIKGKALAECYQVFRSNGGVTAADFRRFLPNYFKRKVKEKPVLRRGELRLVVSQGNIHSRREQAQQAARSHE